MKTPLEKQLLKERRKKIMDRLKLARKIKKELQEDLTDDESEDNRPEGSEGDVQKTL